MGERGSKEKPSQRETGRKEEELIAQTEETNWTGRQGKRKAKKKAQGGTGGYFLFFVPQHFALFPFVQSRYTMEDNGGKGNRGGREEGREVGGRG